MIRGGGCSEPVRPPAGLALCESSAACVLAAWSVGLPGVAKLRDYTGSDYGRGMEHGDYLTGVREP